MEIEKHMTQEELRKLADKELRTEAKEIKYASITNALFIGFLAGIVIYSFVKNSYGFFTLIPLYFIYRLVNNSKNDSGLKSTSK